jgi:hypothetical protein
MDVAHGTVDARRQVHQAHGGGRFEVARAAGPDLRIDGLDAELDQEIERGDPLELETLHGHLAAKERLADERLIDELPRMPVDLVDAAAA